MKNIIGLLVFITIVLILSLSCGFIGIYNNLQALDENANSKWAQVENQLKRRSDLIPNIVATVKGYSAHEKSIYEDITSAREKLAGAISKKDMKAIKSSNNELSKTLGRLLAIGESNPELKANQNFLALQKELAQTENLLANARQGYNESVKLLNTQIRLIPNCIVAWIIRLEQREYFEITESESAVPKVQF
ncbi:LemA family protein [bacterium]|nr:LemA family protein [bacterium]